MKLRIDVKFRIGEKMPLMVRLRKPDVYGWRYITFGDFSISIHLDRNYKQHEQEHHLQ